MPSYMLQTSAHSAMSMLLICTRNPRDNSFYDPMLCFCLYDDYTIWLAFSRYRNLIAVSSHCISNCRLIALKVSATDALRKLMNTVLVQSRIFLLIIPIAKCYGLCLCNCFLYFYVYIWVVSFSFSWFNNVLLSFALSF